MTATGHAQARHVAVGTRTIGPGVPAGVRLACRARRRDRSDALRRATPDERSGGYAYLHAFRGGDTCLVETSATGSALVRGPAVHTNHYLDPGLAAAGAPPSPGSLGRYERLVSAGERGAAPHAGGGDGDPVRPRLHALGDLPAPRPGRGRRRRGRDLLDGLRRRGRAGCGSRRAGPARRPSRRSTSRSWSSARPRGRVPRCGCRGA